MADITLIAILNNPEYVRRMLPTKREAEVLMFAKFRKTVMTKDVTLKFDISCQQAANYLCSLYRKGFFERKRLPDPTGGFMYEYKVKAQLKQMTSPCYRSIE